jgi:inosine-uridine nucleoside N-ribohydrolase
MIPVATALIGTLAALTPVVISSDCGCEMDDQWSIALLVLSPSIDLRAVVSAHAPGLTPKASAAEARRVLNTLPIARKPPVIEGSDVPIPDRKTPRRGPGVDRILAESKGYTRERPLTIIMIGPATDVASALLIDPTLADRAAVVAMAFTSWPAGGDPFNVKNDVAAWQVVTESTIPLIVADCEVTQKHLTLSRSEAKSRFGGLGPAAEGLLAIQARWLDRTPELVRRTTGSADAWPVWDLGAAAVLLGFAKVEQYPRPRLRDDRTFDHDHPTGTIGWVKSIDANRLWADFAAKLKAAP